MPDFLQEITIRPFASSDQIVAKKLIQTGLGERFGFIDDTLNPDINDISASYLQQGAVFIVAELDGQLVGTGALIQETAVAGRIVRVSVDKKYRGMGIGRFITEYLIENGRLIGYKQILVETNEDWHNAIQLYKGCGFQQFDHRNGEIHMQLDL